MGRIPLAEYARRCGIRPATARQNAANGKYQTAKKIGNIWLIDENEPDIDHRFKKNRRV